MKDVGSQNIYISSAADLSQASIAVWLARTGIELAMPPCTGSECTNQTANQQSTYYTGSLLAAWCGGVV